MLMFMLIEIMITKMITKNNNNKKELQILNTSKVH